MPVGVTKFGNIITPSSLSEFRHASIVEGSVRIDQSTKPLIFGVLSFIKMLLRFVGARYLCRCRSTSSLSTSHSPIQHQTDGKGAKRKASKSYHPCRRERRAGRSVFFDTKMKFDKIETFNSQMESVTRAMSTTTTMMQRYYRIAFCSSYNTNLGI